MCMRVCMCVIAYGFMYVRIYVCINACMYLRTMYMRVCTYTCMCMYECM